MTLKRLWAYYTKLGPNQRKWVKFLLRNPDKQVSCTLGLKVGEDGFPSYCALGAAILVTNQGEWSKSRVANSFGQNYLFGVKVGDTLWFEELGLRSCQGALSQPYYQHGTIYYSLLDMNDHNHFPLSFIEIANYMLDNSSNVFVNKQ